MKTKITILFVGILMMVSALSYAGVGVRNGGKVIPSELLGDFVQIPAGTFMMGSPSNETNRESNETQHRVTLTQGFQMMKTEVTQKMWVDVMRENPSYFKGDNNLPVEQVSWDDAQVFIDRLNHKDDGYTYRLPTEAEWEYAARAGTETPFNLGDNISPKKINYNGNYPYKDGQKGIYRSQTVPVGSLPNANAWGLYDMHGNVWEWVLDPYSSDFSKALSQEEASKRNFGSGSYRVFRGGSWFDFARDARSAYRDSYGPDYRGIIVGFRLVRTKN